MKPACTCSTFHFKSSTLFAYEVMSSTDIFFQNQFCCCFFFLKKKSVISVECQAIWIQIMPVWSDLGLNCLQRLSADDTSYDDNLSKLEC